MSKKIFLKTTLSSIWMMSIIIPLSLSVTGCNSQNVNYNSRQLVDVINNKNYEITVAKGTKLSRLETIIKDTIKKKLDEKIQEVFKDSHFLVSKVIKKTAGEASEVKLSDDDLDIIQTTSVEVFYQYKKIDQQVINLTIKIIPNDQQVIDAIDNVSNYQINVNSDSNIKNLGKLIDGFFIAKKLQDNIKVAFKAENFLLRKILKENEEELQAKDFLISGLIKTKILYYYKNINLKGETKLLINISPAASSTIETINQKLKFQQQKIVEVINSFKNDVIEIIVGKKISELKTLIINFIQKKLEITNNNNFISNLFLIKKLFVVESNHELLEQDLEALKKISIKISYDYDQIKDQNLCLVLDIVPFDISKIKQLDNSFTIVIKSQQKIEEKQNSIGFWWRLASKILPGFQEDYDFELEEEIAEIQATTKASYSIEQLKRDIVDKYFNENRDERIFKSFENFVSAKTIIYDENNYQIDIYSDQTTTNLATENDFLKPLYAKIIGQNKLTGVLVVLINLQNDQK